MLSDKIKNNVLSVSVAISHRELYIYKDKTDIKNRVEHEMVTKLAQHIVRRDNLLTTEVSSNYQGDQIWKKECVVLPIDLAKKILEALKLLEMYGIDDVEIEPIGINITQGDTL